MARQEARKAFTKTRIAVILFTVLYATVFYAWYVFTGNTEFVWYLLQFFSFIALACFALWRMPDFPNYLLLPVSFMGLLHVAGGGVKIHGVRLYSYTLIKFFQESPDFTILKYDQVIHFLGFGLCALVIHWVLRHHSPKMPHLERSLLSVFSALGLSVLNEISEFVAVLAFRGGDGVGGYFNLALDLTFNFTGILIAIVLAEIILHFKKKD